jgi:Kef-type K+ transport system membrane component KefB
VALFALLPAFIESHSGNRGAIVLIMFLTAVWLSMFQLRLYAMANPLNSFAAKASRSQSSISNP